MSTVLPPSSSSPPPVFWDQPGLRALRRTGAALHHRNFRWFLTGSFLSNIGTWMQSVAQAWLVLQLTDSAFYLGLDGFANAIPITIFAFWGGVIADRFNRRRMLFATQCIMMALALTLAVLAQTGAVRVWHVIGLSFLTGLTQSVSWPVYQTIMGDIVDRRHLPNAIALNSAQFNMARTIGPMVGAWCLHALGTAGCFYANALSFVAVIAAMAVIRLPAVDHPAHAAKQTFWESLKDGFRYMGSERSLSWLLATLAMASLFGVPVSTLLPVFAKNVLGGDARELGILVAAFGCGAMAAGLFVAYLGDFPKKGRFVLQATALFAVATFLFSFSKILFVSAVCLFVAGGAMICFASVVNSLVQRRAPAHLRGRAMSAFVFSFGGCMPFGSLMAGALAKALGAPHAVALQAVVLAAFVAFVYVRSPQTKELA